MTKRRKFLQSIPRRQLILNGIFGLLLLLVLMRHFRVTVFLQRGHIPGDFAIIWTAGLAAQRGIDMYDPQAARELALAAVGDPAGSATGKRPRGPCGSAGWTAIATAT